MNSFFTDLHSQYMERTNIWLTTHIAELEPSLLKNAMEYSLLAGGKRIRPFLVYATGQMFGCHLDHLDAPAAAVEAIHTYSLIHDDLPAMDNDTLRRGMPTCHIKYDEATAILAGDALQAFAFSLLANAANISDANKIKMIQSLAAASGATGMCLGQSLDLQAENQTISLDELNHIHINKTGALIQTSIALGMYASGGNALDYEEALQSYAKSIGLAFQIQDDILDIIGNKETMGKEQGTDQQLAKSTYISLMGIEQSIHICRTLYKQSLDALDKIPYNSEALRQLADFIVTREN